MDSQIKWHTLDVKDALIKLNTIPDGLSEKEAKQRLSEHGENAIKETRKISALQIFAEQFKSFLILILIIAAIVAAIAGEMLDGTLIILIVIANGIFGFVQDYKAEKSIEALKKLSAPHAVVIRDGKKIDIEAKYIVPGDVIILNEGDRIPADCRLIESFDIETDEAPLTGESNFISKNVKPIDDVTLPERKNMLFMNTDVTRGKGRAVVVATGMQTEIGHIAKSVSEIEKEKTPFQRRIEKLGKDIGKIILLVTIVVFFSQYFVHASDIITIFLISISLAVAAIPEGLPAVTTLSLALGVKRMSKENALVRRLPVVEGLGSVDVICSDKTGTITEGKMKITDIYSNGSSVSAEKFDPTKNEMLIAANVLCNNVTVGDKGGKMQMMGDPTEKAFMEFGMKYISNPEFDKKFPRLDEIAFTSERKMMSTINEYKKNKYVFSKGAPEVILNLCTKIYENDKIVTMTQAKKEEILRKNDEMTKRALRVLAFAYKEIGHDKTHESNLVFMGLEGMLDAPRKEVRDAIKLCKSAGIRVIMITGDNVNTAKAVGETIGLDGFSMEGKDIEKMSKEELAKRVEKINIFARVSPSHKVSLLQALKSNGHIVAMTGDGVNDAPAIKAADVGVSMGIKGTDVAKETSDMILLDDNFATIVSAVREGRRIFDNVKKFVTYLLGANMAEVLIVFIASLFAKIPLAAVHLLWINLLTDGLPALALGNDPASSDIMSRKPSKENVIDRKMIYTIGTIGIIMTAVVLYLFFTAAPAVAQTMAFTALVVFELVKIQVIRSQYHVKLASNKYLLASIAVSFALQLAVLYTPLAIYFKVVPLGIEEWIHIIIGVAISAGVAWGILKFINRKK